MPQLVTLKKLKLNGSMKTYKTFRTNTQKRCAFHYRGLESKSRKSRNTWSNRQIWPWWTEWRWAKANRVLLKKKKHWLYQTTSSNNTREDYTWTSPDGQHQNQIDSILCSQRWRSSIQSEKTRRGADCGSDDDLRLKIEESGENHLTIQVWPKSNPLRLYSGSEK